MSINQDEINDFYESICRNGFDKNDFELQDSDMSKPIPNAGNPIQLVLKVEIKVPAYAVD